MSTLIDSYDEANVDNNDLINSVSGIAAGQSFLGNDMEVTEAKFYLAKLGTPTGTAFAKIYAHTGTFGSSGIPTGNPLAISNSFDVSTLFGSNVLWSFFFTDYKTRLYSNVPYFVVIEYTGGNASNSVSITRDSSSPTHAGNKARFSGGWAATSTDDYAFYIYGVIPSSSITHNLRPAVFKPGLAR